jgi:hypothetical protein
MPVTLVLVSAAEVASTYPAQVASAHRPAEMTTAHPAAATCKRVGRNASASYRYSGNDDHDSVQHKFFHGRFLSG